MRTRVKICGIRDEASALAAAGGGADAVGFMFVASSPRFVEPERAFEIAGALPPFVATVGVTADLTVDEFAELEQRCPATCAQLHGDEAEQVVRRCGPGVIKAVRFDAATIRAELARWAAVEEIDAILVDGSSGGKGEAFDWAALREHVEACAKPVIVAGGLTAENVGEAIRAARPWGVDVSSGVERERGVKDAGLIRAFCDAVRVADSD